MLLAEMLALHYCSDRAETISILEDLLDEARRRIQKGEGVLDKGAARLFWVNPVADVRMMNLVEDCGGRVCGTDFMFGHALDEIPQNMAPIEALAAVALADPMAGSSAERARRICTEARKLGSEGIIISRIPGASHCAAEGKVIGEIVRQESGIPLVEIEVPPVTDAFRAALSTRLEAIVEVITHGRASSAGMRKR
jgi:benzoyl-CoA reductase/2-hydroxyglutaryl-CoA dehydratase subunit BcrC/BadD/HgdB